MSRVPTHDPAAAAGSRPDLSGRVAAVLVVHGRQPWHEIVGRRLAVRPPDRLVVVANGPAPAAAQIADACGGALVVLDRPLGYGDAVVAGVTHPVAADADLLWLLHDDLVCDPDALDLLVATLDARPHVDIVGPKLMDWSREPTLQSVGLTIDAIGRTEPGLEAGELDQGQHDHRDRTLYVPSAGMLIRREVFWTLGGFDRRMTALRDDLDLCWRAWLAGSEVEVVPEAVAWHVAATARSQRGDRWHGPRGARYLSERHALAAMCKNLGLVRLAWTLPVYLLVALARSVGFLLTRRVAVAVTPAAAVAWNVANLPGTLRLRRDVQRSRVRSDGEIAHLLAPSSQRVRAYAEAVVDAVRQGDVRALGRPEGQAPRRPGEAQDRAPVPARHPALVVGCLLAVAWAIAVSPLLGAGQIVGGQIAPWPAHASAFLDAYTSGWSTAPLASGAFPSPLQPVLALAGAVAGGGAWAAQRLVVLGLVPLAWLTALRAGRLLTARPGARALGATLYAASPVVLGGFAQGRLDVLVVAAALPLLLVMTARTAQPGIPPGQAWRAAAALGVMGAVTVAAAPEAWPVVVVPVLVVAAIAALNRPGRLTVAWRLLAAAGAAAGLLLPWLLTLDDDVVGRTDPVVTARMWQTITAQTGLLDGLPPLAALVWTVAAAAAVAVAVGVRLARRRPLGDVLVLLVALLAAGGAGAVSVRTGVGPWAPLVVVPAALALAGLGVVAVRSVSDMRAASSWRPRHAVALVGLLLLVAGPVATVTSVVAQRQWAALTAGADLVPPFVDADAERVGPYRVLLLEGDAAGMAYDVVGAGGPRMTSYGTREDAALRKAVDDAVAGLLSGRREAVGALGLLNVRYVVSRDGATSDVVAAAVGSLEGVEPLAAGGGRVLQVRSWLPRAAAVDAGLLAAAAQGRALDAAAADATALPPAGVGRYATTSADSTPGGPVTGDVLWLSEAAPAQWRAEASGRPLTQVDPVGSLPVTAFDLDGPTEGLDVRVDPQARRLWIAWQLLVLGLVVSLALRAPGSAVPTRPARTEPPARRAGSHAGVPAGAGRSA